MIEKRYMFIALGKGSRSKLQHISSFTVEIGPLRVSKSLKKPTLSKHFATTIKAKKSVLIMLLHRSQERQHDFTP